MARSRTVRLSTLILACSLAACTVQNVPTGTGPTSAGPVPDPPHAFDPTPIGIGPVAPGYYVADNAQIVAIEPPRHQVHTFDVVTGDRVSTVDVPVVPLKTERVRLERVDDVVSMFVAGPHTAIGQGTQSDTENLRIMRVATDTGQTLWTSDLPWPGIGKGAFDVLHVVDITKDHVVISVREDRTGPNISHGSTTVVLDVRTGEQRWRKQRFLPFAVAGDHLVGLAPSGDGYRVEGLRAGTGDRAWTWSEAGLERVEIYGEAVGPDLIQIGTHSTSLIESTVETAHLVEIATGRTVVAVDPEPSAARQAGRCVHDGDSLVVCPILGDTPALVGYDAATGRERWRIDANTPGRKVPDLIDARHGVVYVGNKTTLDGRTGADLDVNVGAEVARVFAGYGLRLDSSDRLLIHRAVR